MRGVGGGAKNFFAPKIYVCLGSPYLSFLNSVSQKSNFGGIFPIHQGNMGPRVQTVRVDDFKQCELEKKKEKYCIRVGFELRISGSTHRAATNTPLALLEHFA